MEKAAIGTLNIAAPRNDMSQPARNPPRVQLPSNLFRPCPVSNPEPSILRLHPPLPDSGYGLGFPARLDVALPQQHKLVMAQHQVLVPPLILAAFPRRAGRLRLAPLMAVPVATIDLDHQVRLDQHVDMAAPNGVVPAVDNARVSEPAQRSEERRVGEEGRSRWAPYR